MQIEEEKRLKLDCLKNYTGVTEDRIKEGNNRMKSQRSNSCVTEDRIKEKNITMKHMDQIQVN
uniref:Uncharacterized protein n=1 Tax=Oryza nivara TaxID=4536 RepID=A0A0E0HZZ0_ORYNI